MIRTCLLDQLQDRESNNTRHKSKRWGKGKGTRVVFRELGRGGSWGLHTVDPISRAAVSQPGQSAISKKKLQPGTRGNPFTTRTRKWIQASLTPKNIFNCLWWRFGERVSEDRRWVRKWTPTGVPLPRASPPHRNILHFFCSPETFQEIHLRSQCFWENFMTVT